MKKVVVLGGGVAGMTAAHELGERGYDVTIYEARPYVAGGKARTQPVTALTLHHSQNSAPQPPSPQNEPLPGEHGFRFFPGFYKHVPDTMRRIPFPGNPDGVLDNLRSVELGVFAPRFREMFPTPVRFPRSLEEFRAGMEMPEELRRCGLTDDDFAFFVGKLFQFATSCPERRNQEYSRISWWDFVEAERRSEAYQLYLATGITRNAVATQAHLANTKTIGDVGLQLILDMTTPGTSADRVLVGPTNKVWIDPWLAHLREAFDVDYVLGARVTALHFDHMLGEQGQITGVDVEFTREGETWTERVTADHYVLALPVEVTARLLAEQGQRAREAGGEPLAAHDNSLKGLEQLQHQVNWMTGIQYYLREEVKITRGHINALGTPWALTALEECQFWPSVDMSRLGDGTYKSIISVDISDWDTPGVPEGQVPHKIARDCTHEEIAQETWLQLKQCLNNGRDAGTLPEEYDAYWLDESIQRSPDPKKTGYNNINTEPLLVNLINSWDLRPDAWTRTDNLVLAGDYVRTNTDFASMEGACEAGRRAANTILVRDGYTGPMGLADVWELEEPALLDPFKEADRERWGRGLPWAPPSEIPVDMKRDLDHAVHDVAEKGGQLLEELHPLRLLSNLRESVEELLGTPDGETVEDRARQIMERNADRNLRTPPHPWMAVQTWSNLLFLHNRVLSQDIRSLVHPELEIEEFDGSAWVTLVPMYMARIYLAGVGEVPGQRHFPELNLRTYVRHKGRPGVWFFRINANQRLASWAARSFFFMPYNYASMSFQKKGQTMSMVSRHHCQDGHAAILDCSWSPRGAGALCQPNSLHSFLAERYAAYGARRDGEGAWSTLMRGDIMHDPWVLCDQVDVDIRRNNIWAREGIPLMEAPPEGAHFNKVSLACASSGVNSVMWGFEPV
jgi:uncharacterized protein YqjF (DUF2071 family)/uncharacterized protein with NAD-binding domain and iron-sulfur cluster